MELNTSSISAKLYRWFYDENKMPSNLCPYFWKLIAMWIFIVPMFIISYPVILINRFTNEQIFYNDDSLIYKLLKSLVIYSIIFIICTMLFSFSIFYVSENFFNKYEVCYIFGIVGNLLLIVIIIALGIDTLVKCNYKKPKINLNIIKEFIKAKYNKYCPKIDWK